MGTQDPAIVFYDGECGFCDWSVQWLMDHDPAGRFKFAPLQGETAAEHGVQATSDPDTVVLMMPQGEGYRRHEQSDAILQIVGLLGWPWRLFRLGILLPRFLRDAAYRLFARNRYKVWGRLEACRIPSPEERLRFLP